MRGFGPGELLTTIYSSDPQKAKRGNRPTMGRIVSVGGGYAEIDIGATLSDGTPQTVKLPCVVGFNGSAGQTAAITYSTDSPHSGLVVALGSSVG